MSKKSKKRRGSTPPGQDPNVLRQQRLEARRQAKAEAEAARRKQQLRERLIRYVIYAGLFALAIWFVFLRNAAPTEIDGNPIRTFSQSGVNQHTSETQQYPTTPAVSGAHAPQPSTCGVIGQSVPPENSVHALEHGAVGINFGPEVDPETIKDIEALVGEYEENVYSAPLAGMEAPIVISSWGRMMELETFDKAVVAEYIEAFAGKGPEAGQNCPNTADSPFVVPSPAPTGVESPAPDASPTGGAKDDKKDAGTPSP
jgi:hypothetical protein